MSSEVKNAVNIASALGVYAGIEVSFVQVLSREHHSILTSVAERSLSLLNLVEMLYQPST